MAEIHHHFDLPSDWESLPPYVLVRGWCYAYKGEPIRGVRLHSQNVSIDGEIRKYRPDVKLAFPDSPDDFTGFEIRGELPSGRRHLHIEVQLEDRHWQAIASHSVKIQRRGLPLWLGNGNWSELTGLQVSCHRQYPPCALIAERFPATALERTQWPHLSIVTPSLQQAHFLVGTIRSVLEQHPANIEYIVQDGGSTDGSTEIIRRFASEEGDSSDPSKHSIAASFHQTPTTRPALPESKTHNSSITTSRITAWASEPDAGQADAIAKGFAKTTGGPDDLMAWINSDDFYLSGTFAFVADFFARHPEVDVIYGHRLLVDENSQEIGRWFLPPHDDEVLKRYDFVPQETMFWRRRIWDKAGGLDTSLKFAMDWDLLLRFQAASAKIVRVPYFLACFRVHPGQKTSALMETIGQGEIDALRTRTFGRQVPSTEIENDPVLMGYLRRSAWIRFLWKLSVRL